MPKHTVELPCSVGDEVMVSCCNGGQEQMTAVIQEVRYGESRHNAEVRVIAGIKNPSNRRTYLWGVSAFAKEDTQ